MPDSLHPPYNVIQPRQLNRWLDVNSQNGPLGRTRKFLTLPAFGAVVIDWQGYSDVVATYNYVASNNFSFVNNTPSGLNFLLCIAYLNADGSIVRYKLNQDVGEVFYLANVTLYAGEMIKKNFRFEVWSAAAVSPIMLLPIVFVSTIKGNIDYRYGVDTECGSISAQCNTEQNIPPAIPVQPSQTAIGSWWKNNTGLTIVGGTNISSWVDRVAGAPMTQALAPQQPNYLAGIPQSIECLGTQLLFYAGWGLGKISELFIYTIFPVGPADNSNIIVACNTTTGGQDLIVRNNTNSGIRVTARGVTTDVPFIAPQSASYSAFIINLRFEANRGIYYYFSSGALMSYTPINYSAAPTPINIVVGDNGGTALTGFNVGDIVTYTAPLSDADRVTTMLYLSGGIEINLPWSLPLTFYPCAQLIANNT